MKKFNKFWLAFTAGATAFLATGIITGKAEVFITAGITAGTAAIAVLVGPSNKENK